jgi:predicted extracellular nuclease
MLIDYIETPEIFAQDTVRLPVVGDRFTAPVVGVMSYSYGNYKLRPTSQLPTLSRANLPRESVEPAPPNVLSVAAFNVYNLSPRDEPAKFQDIAETIVLGLASPDIVVLSEVQDGDGSANTDLVSADVTAGLLLEAIVQEGGPSDYVYVDVPPERGRDGGQPGGNIRVGFLFREDRVELVSRPGGDASTPAAVVSHGGAPALEPSPARVDPGNRAFSGSRKPVAAQFTFDGQPLFVVGNHFNSKGGDGYLFGQVQPPTFSTEHRRVLQAGVVRNFVEEILAVDPDAYVIVAGDLNDFAFSAPLRELSGPDCSLVNLAAELLPESEIYSYIYEGNSQVLDHILVSPDCVLTRTLL